MSRKFKKIKSYQYECTMTGEKFTTTREAPRPGDLVSVQAYYQLNIEDDDRPEFVKKVIEEEVQQAEIDSTAEEKAEADRKEKRAEKLK